MVVTWFVRHTGYFKDGGGRRSREGPPTRSAPSPGPIRRRHPGTNPGDSYRGSPVPMLEKPVDSDVLRKTVTSLLPPAK